MEYSINQTLTKDLIMNLKAGDIVKFTGKVFAARDAAHKKIIELIENKNELPIDLKDQIIYYVGPCPNKGSQIIGSCGPTTSERMDVYTPKLLELGLSGMIGKGDRKDFVVESIKKYKAVYFGATGGAGALISKCVVSQRVIAFLELGTEALRELVVKEFDLVVVIDCYGNNLYKRR